MLRYEWKKVLGSRPVIISVLSLLFINAIVCYFQTKPNPKEVPTDIFAPFFEMYLSDEDTMQKEYLQMQEFTSEQQRIWAEQMALGNRDFEMREWKNKYAPEGFTDAQLFHYVMSLKEYTEDFPDKIDHAIRAAYAQIINSASDTIDTGSYLYRYQEKVIRTYRNVYDHVKLTPEYVRGYHEYFSYDFMPIFLFVSVIIISGFVFTNEHQLGAAPLIYTTKNGRLRITLSKIAVVYGSAVILCLLFCAQTLFIINITTGFSQIDSPIQIVSDFLYCPLIVSIKEYLLIDFAFKLIAVFLFTAISAAISAGFCNYLFTYIGSLGLLGMDYVFFILKFPSGENLMRALNLMSISTSKNILNQYRAVRFGNTPIDYCSVILIAFAIVIVFLTAFVVIKYSRVRTIKTMSRIKIKRKPYSLPKKNENSLHAKKEYSMSLFGAELYKTTISSKLILAACALFIMKSCIVYSDFQSVNSYADEMYHTYMSELAGPINDEKRLYIQDERKFISETCSSYEAVSEAYRHDEITLDEYRAYLSEYNYAFSHSDALTRIENHVFYIDKMASEGKEAWFVYDTGWQRLLTREFDWSLYALMILLCSGIFASEYNSRTSSAGFHQILRTTKQGRGKTFREKVRISLLLSFVFSLIWSLIDLAGVISAYELPAPNAPIVSAQYFAGMESAMTFSQFAALSILVKILAYMVLSILTTALSLFLRKNISAMVFITMLTLLPRILSTLGMSYLKRIDYVDIMEATPILLRNTEGSIFMLITAISSICVILLSQRMWSK